jgi:hypothetical protein
MNIIDEFDHVSTFDYIDDKSENADVSSECNSINQWLDDLGWV